jgi:hypothetical protein
MRSCSPTPPRLFWLRMNTLDWLAAGHAGLAAAETEAELPKVGERSRVCSGR